MEAEKKERSPEETREIIVLDAGIRDDDESDWVCCLANYILLRW